MTAPAHRRRRRRRGASERLRAGRRPRGARRAGDGHQAVLRQPNRFGDEPNTNIDPVTLGLPGALPVLNRQAVELAMRIGAGAQLHGAAVHVPPQELLLPRHAEGVPDQPVRPAAQRRRLARPARRHARRHRAGPPRGGHRQVHAHRRRRRAASTAARHSLHRLQPRRRAARRDRQPPRHPHRRAGPPVRHRAARHPRRRRRLRRQDGGGVDARRRQRQRAPARRAVRHPLRDQERQLGALARPGHRVRGAPPDRPARGRRARSARRPATGTRATGARTRCAPRRTPTTTATSSSPTSCRSRRTPSGSRRVRASLPPCCPPRAGPALAEATGAAADGEAVVVVVERGQDDYVLAVAAAGGDAGPGAGARQGGVRRPGPDAARARGRPGRADHAGESTAGSPPRRPRPCSPSSWPSGGRRCRRHRRRQGLRGDGHRRRSTPLVDEAIAAHPAAWDEVSSPARTRRWARSSAR